ncbi:MAG: CpaF family protein, partial [Alphaproteobacteria bacterium]|nr:CpaF family protein [Alphaproteobacteria bacterium]
MQAAARKAESYAAKPASPAAARLAALASRPRPEAEPAPARNAPGPKSTPGFEQLKKAQAGAEIVREQADYYHATKTTIFNALMNTIDLAQLAGLDPKAAAEEIRDIVAELVAIKNVSMSVAEQEHLVQDIVNDVLGYGPLEPLLARDDIADIMVNG